MNTVFSILLQASTVWFMLHGSKAFTHKSSESHRHIYDTEVTSKTIVPGETPIPSSTIAYDNSVVYNNEKCDVMECNSEEVVLKGRTTGMSYQVPRSLDVLANWEAKKPSKQMEIHGKKMTVSYTVFIDGVEKTFTHELVNDIIVMHDEPQPRPDWLYNWEKPENPSWNMAFRF